MRAIQIWKRQWLCGLLMLLLGILSVAAEEPSPALFKGDAADIAVEAAQQYRGSTLRISYEAGLQALDGYFFGPEWTRLTGINVEVIEYDAEEEYANVVARKYPLDVISLTPAWMGDYVAAGLLEPLDAYLARYYPAKELADIHPTFLQNWSKVGAATYGVPDDGDVLILYYRRDLFEDPANRAEFRNTYRYELQAPETWSQWDDICAFFTNKYAPALYGCGMPHIGMIHYWFESVFRSYGGEFFDPETMKAQVNNAIGVKTAQTLVASLPSQPPGAKDWSFMEAFSAWLEGKLAMTITWPPIGRWSEGYGRQVEQLDFVPPTKVAGKVGYALQPGGSELAGGYSLGVSADSEHKEAAYLLLQWLSSEKISLQRTMTPFALRDPYRLSHYVSPLYKAQWKSAAAYLEVLKKGAETGYLDLTMPGAHEYEQAEEQALIALYAGADIQTTLDTLATKWDAITQRLGAATQREAYLKWRTLPNAYPKRQ